VQLGLGSICLIFIVVFVKISFERVSLNFVISAVLYGGAINFGPLLSALTGEGIPQFIASHRFLKDDVTIN